MKITKEFVDSLKPHIDNIIEDRYINSEDSLFKTIIDLKFAIEQWNIIMKVILFNSRWRMFVGKNLKHLEKIRNNLGSTNWYVFGSELVFSELVPENVIYGLCVLENQFWIPKDPSKLISKVNLLTKDEAIIKDIIQ